MLEFFGILLCCTIEAIDLAGRVLRQILVWYLRRFFINHGWFAAVLFICNGFKFAPFEQFKEIFILGTLVHLTVAGLAILVLLYGYKLRRIEVEFE